MIFLECILSCFRPFLDFRYFNVPKKFVLFLTKFRVKFLIQDNNEVL